MSAIRQLASKIVDYAGLFPPASLDLKQAAENYSRYREGPFQWMLGRFVIPAARLGELEQSAGLPMGPLAEPWRISALVPEICAPQSAFKTAIDGIRDFNFRHEDATNGLAIVDAIEVKASEPNELADLVVALPEMGLNIFVEIPIERDPTSLIQQIVGRRSVYAKVRTGGITPEAFPGVGELARLVASCAREDVGFKATAGLHHPLRGDYRLTYDVPPCLGSMFGFLNLFIAGSLAFARNLDVRQISEILLASLPDSFAFEGDVLRWRSYELHADEIARLRATKVISFGSCSFDEPTTELRELGLLARDAVHYS
jgi:hypothetical protein